MLWQFHGYFINLNTGLYHFIMTAGDVALLSLVSRQSEVRNRRQKLAPETGSRNRVAPTQDISWLVQLIFLIFGIVMLGLTGVLAAWLLGENRFGMVRLLCDGLFWHGFAGRVWQGCCGGVSLW